VAHALPRLLTEGQLEHLTLEQENYARGEPFLDRDGALALSEGIRDSRTLQSVSLAVESIWTDREPGSTLMRAFINHPTLRSLKVVGVVSAVLRADVARMFGQLLAADTPALHTLSLNMLGIGVGVVSIAAGLARNTHLKKLMLCEGGGGNRRNFVHNHLLPAVRVNTSLRVLRLDGALSGFPDAELAQRIVAERSNGAQNEGRTGGLDKRVDASA
jgi:hypothetical protein